MTARAFEVPELVRRRALLKGEIGARWLAGLSELVDDLERRWQVRAESVLGGGTEALVLASVRADGEPVVMKIVPPDSGELATEARALRLAKGAGYASLLEHDDSRNALLLERLGEKLVDLGLPVREQIELICETLRSAWLELDSPSGLMTGAEKARWLAEFIAVTWDELDRPARPPSWTGRSRSQRSASARTTPRAACSSTVTRMAGIRCGGATIRARHLASSRRSRRAVRGPACDLAISMREWNDELLAGDALRLGRARCALLHELTGVDEAPIWQWGFVERVSTGLLFIRLGQTAEAQQHFAIARRWMAA
jgi:streptomycin 6-kinase